MSIPSRSQRLRRPAAVLFLAALLLPSAATAAGPPAPAPDLLPDLRMLAPQHTRIERRAGGVRWLRFTTIFVNVGQGPFEIRGRRTCASLVTCPRMTVRQRFLRADGTWYNEATTARMKLEVGDQHNHWHVIGMERFELFSLTRPGGGEPLAGAKFGFCFFDLRPYQLGLPGAPSTRVYPESGTDTHNGCGDRDDLANRMGLSVGWQDIYPWSFAGQWIDITGVADGAYLLCVSADPMDRFRERYERNNQAWARLAIKGGTVRVLATGRQRCEQQLPRQ